MGTSLTPEFWREFAVLLVIAMAVTVVLSAMLDAVYLRSQQHRAARRASGTGTPGTPSGTSGTARRPERPAVRTPVKS
ncbi:hypothetical protein [Streptomyces sp. SAS_270]|uniref:hypothetical protein n=1 Tax=Streptomyces sp. SAS_270 TaxID=3412748 RepID=UPI00403C3775